MPGVISFSAAISGDSYSVENGSTLIYDNVSTNNGDGYDIGTGIFTSPEDGVYAIFVEVSVEKKETLNLELLLNEKQVSEITVEAPMNKVASVSRNWVLNLDQGSKVRVRSMEKGDVRGKMQTTFSGWKINGADGSSTSTDTADGTDISKLPAQFMKDLKEKMKKYDVLRDLDIFVLDNSMRESTVGQLRGHIPEDKWKIFAEVKKCSFKHTIVASFAHETRVDDQFIKELAASHEDKDYLYGFSEITYEAKGGVPDTEKLPVGVRKMEEVGLYNIIFEIDLGDSVYDFNKFSVQQMCQLIKKLVTYCHDNLNENAKVLFNFRDLPDVIPAHLDRFFTVVDFMAKLPPRLRLFGIMFEEPRGKSMPEECSLWARYFRKIMDANNWKGNLLVHVHENYGYCDVTALEVLINGANGVWASVCLEGAHMGNAASCLMLMNLIRLGIKKVLMNGANGVWASVCLEGAHMGNAASCVTLMNLVRLGNKKVLNKYNCHYLRQAAINVTKITTGKEPDIKQPFYGARALDFVFDLNPAEFDLAEFFGEKAPVRMTTMASAKMIQTKLHNVFGDDEQFTEDMGQKMREKILEDMREGRKEEYMSKYGLAVLFDRCGGSLTEAMSKILAEGELRTPNAKNLIAEVRYKWDQWDWQDDKQNDDMLNFDSFYDGFLSTYFGCYRCSDTMKALKCIDMDNDGYIDWHEFKIYLTWALYEYPDIDNMDTLLETTFQKGIIPAMRDEYLSKKEQGDFY